MMSWGRCSIVLVALLAAACGKKNDQAGTAAATDAAVTVDGPEAPPTDATDATAPEVLDAATAAAPAPTSLTAAHHELIESAFEASQNLARDLHDAGDDCKAAAKALKTHSKDFVPVLDLRSRINPTQDPALDTWFDDAYGKRMARNLNALLKSSGACGDDPAFDRALEKLGTAGGKQK